MKKYRFDEGQLAMMEQSRIPFAVYQFIDKRVVTIAVSEGLRELIGCETLHEAYELMDNDMYRGTHPDDAARVANAAFRFATEDGGYDVVYRNRGLHDAAYRVIHAIGKHFYSETGERLAAVWYTDEGPVDPGNNPASGADSLPVRRPEENQFERRNHYDFLTGLPNMTFFFELAEAARMKLARVGKKPAILFIDLSGMKYFNRRYGFAEGDRLIRAVSHLLIRHFGSENCSRFAQDHFAAITDTEGLEDRVQAFIEDCGQANDGRTLPVRVGIYRDDMTDIDISMACDMAKYACDTDKKAYGSCYRFYSKEMLKTSLKRQYIIDNLDRAIREGWIQVYYQPIVRAANGRVCDEESLARWIDPVNGLMSPAEFIPVLEDARLIYRLDLYVVEKTLEKMKAQAEAGLYLVPGSVNLSRTDFDACDIVEEVRKRVDASGLAREMLNIEITESTVGSDFEFMTEQIRRFRELGFQVWMDDFGSGYSSLDTLQSARFDLIKLDMRFMQQFDNSDRSKVILTELIRMALGLGVETVVEGVERADQVEFLKEIGCTKLQGYYYTRPIPYEQILERYRSGKQVGFENPEESEYYASVGRINLYDVGIVSGEENRSFHHYFDTMPMAVLEWDGKQAVVLRCNRSYRDFVHRTFGVMKPGKETPIGEDRTGPGQALVRAVRQCSEEGRRMFIDEELPNGATIHAFVRRIAVNHVTGITACAAVVLGISDKSERELTYTNIAKALAADYMNLYYVDLDTEKFIEYRTDTGRDDLDVERHGEDFFNASRKDAMRFVHETERDMFVQAFTKQNIVRALDTTGAFTLTYRLLIDGAPTYVNMKAIRINTGDNHIIIGVNNVDAQMRHQEALERLKEERITYARINALNGDYICIYAVDPDTDRYVEYSATRDYRGLGLAKEGEDFFNQARKESVRTICPEDLELFQSAFTKEKVLRAIRENGLYVLNYRLMMDGTPRYICLKVARMEEKDGPRLIVGVNNIDAQVRRDQEYAHNLAVARNLANIDELTGVKNRHAYADMEANLNRLISEGRPVRFAVAVFDISGLKAVNERKGFEAGDALLRQGCDIICDLFKHSPVYRMGGNVFAVVTRGRDYDNLEALMAALEATNSAEAERDGAVVLGGCSRYNGDDDVAVVFRRADDALRQRKRQWKQS